MINHQSLHPARFRPPQQLLSNVMAFMRPGGTRMLVVIVPILPTILALLVMHLGATFQASVFRVVMINVMINVIIVFAAR